jgi:hypothetical protein
LLGSTDPISVAPPDVLSVTPVVVAVGAAALAAGASASATTSAAGTHSADLLMSFMRFPRCRLPLATSTTRRRRQGSGAYFAYSTARDSRMTVTLIWPGYSSCCSISRAISWLRSAIPSSSTVAGATMILTSRPACMA